MKQTENAQIESWVIGAILDKDNAFLGTDAAKLCSELGLVADDFVGQENKSAFLAIESLVSRNRTVDIQTVGVISGVPATKLAVLVAKNIASKETLRVHAEELRRMRHIRSLQGFGKRMLAWTDAPNASPEQIAKSLEEFSRSFAATNETDETGASDLFEILEEWDAFTRGERTPYLKTGIECFDAEVGGFVPNLNVVGALPSGWKSAFIATCIESCLQRGERVGLFGLEDATKWLSKRLLARRIGVQVGDIAAIRMGEWVADNLDMASKEIHLLMGNLLAHRRAGIDPATLIAKCKHWILNKGVKAIFIDHGGEIQHEHGTRDRYDLAVASTYRHLRDLAVNYRVPIVVLCHFNREADKSLDGKPRLTNFAETEYIARMARLALGLWSSPDAPDELRCTILKRTDGERGQTLVLKKDLRAALIKRDGGKLLPDEPKPQKPGTWKGDDS